jgi:hypothetical protein
MGLVRNAPPCWALGPQEAQKEARKRVGCYGSSGLHDQAHGRALRHGERLVRIELEILIEEVR